MKHKFDFSKIRTNAVVTEIYNVIENGPDSFDYIVKSFATIKSSAMGFGGCDGLAKANIYKDMMMKENAYLGYGYTVEKAEK